jgi:probable F420-dependent oxidoreductase
MWVRSVAVHIGVVFPQTEIGADVGAIRAYAERVEELGFHHIRAMDHVLGADPAVHPGWNGPFDIDTTFHEVFVLFGYLAAVTSLELVTGALVLPQRQTALVAKQAAEIDLLTRGRFRLGVGVGWNAVEFEALDQRFTDRGQRTDEQIDLLRRLWTHRSTTYSGAHHVVTGAGIAPLPLQRPIPLWIGALSAPGYRRAGRVADGWFAPGLPGPELDAAREVVDRAAEAAGRDPASIGMEGRAWGGNIGVVLSRVEGWLRAGATHLSVDTMNAGLTGVDEHLAVLAEAAADLDLDGTPTLDRRAVDAKS